MEDCLIIGGGVIGLSIAYELAGRGSSVRVLDAGAPGREASWAGAGILPPPPARTTAAIHQLAELSGRLHAEWAPRLLAETGIDNGYRSCGGIHLALDDAQVRELMLAAAEWRALGIEARHIGAGALETLERGLCEQALIREAYFLPAEKQIRNPRHLAALLAACAGRGVHVTAGAPVEDVQLHGSRVTGVRTVLGPFQAEQFVVATGAWTRALMQCLGIALAIKPIRGQIALVRTPTPVLTRIVNLGKRYVVPRSDGHVLIGSTEEDVGYNRATTVEAVQSLLEMAVRIAPSLAGGTLERAWAGLRPGTRDGLPYIGRVPGIDNLTVAAGHFRSGLELSTGTAVVVSRLVRGEDPQIDLASMRVDRD